MRDHECDDLGGNLLRGRDEVSLVLAVFIVHDDDDTAVPQCLKRVFDLGIFLTHRHVLIYDHSRANHLVSSLTVATSRDQLTLFYTNRPVPALVRGLALACPVALRTNPGHTEEQRKPGRKTWPGPGRKRLDSERELPPWRSQTPPRHSGYRASKTAITFPRASSWSAMKPCPASRKRSSSTESSTCPHPRGGISMPFHTRRCLPGWVTSGRIPQELRPAITERSNSTWKMFRSPTSH